MPRKSPRARKKGAAEPRLPGKARPRSTPGSARTKGRSTASRGKAARAKRATPHSVKGARGTATAPSQRGRTVKPARRALRSVPREGPLTPPDRERVTAILAILERTYPDAKCALDFRTPHQLLVATILSAQCTDVRVNQVTPALFARYPDPAAFAAASLPELESMVRSTGFFRMKAKAIQSSSADIVARHGGEVPRTLEELTTLRGAGRKTANVVLGNAFGIPGVVVDTHVSRVSRRLGLHDQNDPVKIEFALMSIVPRERWTMFSHWLILHGRRTCVARKPRCSICPLVHCPRVGVTASQ
ncbi:MAG TPA: endonuclease III [Candidatus Limnocylindria bacterium]|nr:endonuclease III [Candidatus Limnocylindria bacterium]